MIRYYVCIGFLLLGCDYVIDKFKDDLWIVVKVFFFKGYEVVFDVNGIEIL